MGWKKIQAKLRADQEEIHRALGKFQDDAMDINKHILLAQKIADEALEQISKISERSADEAEKVMEAVKTSASRLETQGIVELEHVKRTLLLSIRLRAPFPKPVDLREVSALYQNWSREAAKRMEDEQNAYIDKLAASWPAAITAGMTFKNRNGTLAEVRSGPHLIPGSPGDHGVSYELEMYGTVEAFQQGHAERIHLTKAQLNPRQGWKYVHT